MLVKSIIIILVGLVAIFLLFPATCKYFEQPKSYFSNYDEAKNSGIMEAGWMPTFIPRTSTEIHEQHDIDSNLVYMTFKYEQSEDIDLSRHCSRKQKLENGMRYFCSYRNSSPILDLYSDGTGKLNPSNESRF